MLVAAGGWVILASGMDPSPAATSVAAAGIGGLLPDIDHPGSFVGRRLLFLSVPIAAMLGHRGFTHSLLAVVAATWLLVSAFRWEADLGAALAFGYLSHLAGDWLTERGIPLLWPWRRHFAAPITLKTGGVIEHMLDVMLLGFVVWSLGSAAARAPIW
jgi:inner membrane protein